MSKKIETFIPDEAKYDAKMKEQKKAKKPKKAKKALKEPKESLIDALVSTGKYKEDQILDKSIIDLCDLINKSV